MKYNLPLPDDATDAERQIKWQKISQISDSDFGFNTPKEKTNKIRFCVRLLLLNEDNLICVVKSDKHGYLQLPGGGIDAGESIAEGLQREAGEEIGYSIKNVQPIGYVIENREDIRNIYNWSQAISFVFSAQPTQEIGTNYTDYENAEGFRPTWVRLDDFIADQEKYEDEPKDYNGCFSNKRDLLIAKFFKTMKQNQ